MSRRAFYEQMLQNPNVKAMLNVIASCEGATYNTIFTGATFNNFADHPRILKASKGLSSDASGRYQFLSTTWDSIKRTVGATDFSPHNQDLAAVALIDRRGALRATLAGDIPTAMQTLSYEWASLPPFRYKGQGQCTMQKVIQKFKEYQGKPIGYSDKSMPGSFSGPPSSSEGGGIGTITSGKNCPPPPYSVIERITYTGCPTKVASARPAGNGQAFSAPAMQVLGEGGVPSVGVAPDFTPNPGAFITPMKGVFTSPYGWRWGRMHRGVDIAAPIGTPIIASADGVVIGAGWNSGGYGNLVELRHNNGWETIYAHTSKMLVKNGQRVKQGQVIALCGSTGDSTGPHLHFEIIIPGKGATNPAKYIKLGPLG